MGLEQILLFLSLFLDVLILFVLFFSSVFVVRFRTDVMSYLRSTLETLPPTPQQDSNKTPEKTWDQKYEDELESISKRIRQDSREVL